MKPEHKKSKRLKEVRGILKRQWEISKEISKLGYVKLEKPIRHGWFKEIVITQNVDRYKQKECIIELFNCVQKYYWGRTKEIAEKKWINRVSKHLIYKEFPTISRKEFNRLSEGAKAMCTSFIYKNEGKKTRLRFYVRIPKGVYRIKYTRAYITHSKRIDPTLESEYQFLNNQLLKEGYYEANIKLCGWNSNKDYWTACDFKKEKLEVDKQLKALKKYPIKDVLNGKISWERN